MSQSVEAQEAAEAAAKEAAAKAADEATKAAEEAAAAAKEKANALPELPEELKWMGEEIKSLRQEAGGYRTKLRDLTEQFKGAVSAEDFDAAVARVREGSEELILKDALRENDLPAELAPLLQGGTAEETYARAAALKAVMTSGVQPNVLNVNQLHSGRGPQGGPPAPASGREAYRLKHKRN